MSNELDNVLDMLEFRIASLSREKFSAFFATCAEQHRNLFEEFCRANNWGDESTVSRALSKVWSCLAAEGSFSCGTLVVELEKATPDAEDHDTLQATLAQDAIICTDAALRGACTQDEIDPRWVEFALEPAKTLAMLDWYQVQDLGTTALDRSRRNDVMSHPLLVSALESYSALLDLLERVQSIGPAEVTLLKEFAADRRLSYPASA